MAVHVAKIGESVSENETLLMPKKKKMKFLYHFADLAVRFEDTALTALFQKPKGIPVFKHLHLRTVPLFMQPPAR